MNKSIAAGLLLTAMLPVWTACGTQETEVISSAVEETPIVTETPLKLLGTEKKGENVYHLKIANRTGKDITGFAVNTELLEGENLLPAGDEFKNGETRELWFDAEAALKAAAEAAEENAPEFILALTLADGSTDVPTELTVTLTFTKNVVNFTVKDHNMGCFQLIDSGGNAAPSGGLMVMTPPESDLPM